MNINHLPDDDIIEIFSYLDLETRAVCEQVCPRWKALVPQLPPINYKLIINGFDGAIETDCGLETHRFTRELIADSLEEAKDLLTKYHSPVAIRVQIPSPEMWEDILETIGENLNRLQHLEINFSFDCLTRRQSCLLSKIGSKRLRHLTICQIKREKTGGGNRTGLEMLLNECPNLETLFLNCKCVFDVKAFKSLPPKLTSVSTSASLIKGDDIHIFLSGDVERLKEVHLSGINASQLVTLCNRMSHLRTLKLSDLEIENESQLNPIRNLTDLEDMVLDGTSFDLINGLLDVLKSLPKLKHLDLYNVGNPERLPTVLPILCPQMKQLYLYNKGDFKLSTQGLYSLAKLRNLQKLDILLAGKFTVPTIVHFLSVCKSVKYLAVDAELGSVETLVNLVVSKAKEDKSGKYQLIVCTRDEVTITLANEEVSRNVEVRAVDFKEFLWIRVLCRYSDKRIYIDKGDSAGFTTNKVYLRGQQFILFSRT